MTRAQVRFCSMGSICATINWLIYAISLPLSCRNLCCSRRASLKILPMVALERVSRTLLTAAKVANAHDFIVTLPKGYDTLVGERGMRLSGGERQRIALARAFLKDAPILILDEPTSAIDVATETLIMEAMQRVMAGRTALMIAHRLSTLDICDARIVIEQGHIVEATGNIQVDVSQPVVSGHVV